MGAETQRTAWPGVLLATGYTLALTQGQLSMQALGALLVLAMAALLALHRAAVARRIGHGLFLMLSVVLAAHQWPGFYSAKVMIGAVLSPGALPFTFALNLDKPLIGGWLLLACPAIATRQRWPKLLSTWAGATFACAALLFGLALGFGWLAWAPKWPEGAGWWLANNVLLVCVVEELLFRGYLQGWLARRSGHGPALLVASTLFGLAHWGLGPVWVLLAGLAGVGYGLAWRHGGLLCAIAVHASVNTLHFTLFSYPALAG